MAVVPSNTHAMEDALPVLENRLRLLEFSIFGEKGIDENFPECIDRLSTFQQVLSASTVGKDQTHECFNKIKEIESHLTDTLAESLLDDSKRDIILSREDELRKEADLLKQIQENLDIVESEHIKCVPGMIPKLSSLAQIVYKQKEESEVVTASFNDLLGKYNRVVDMVSKQFVLWDEVLTQLEAEKQGKRGDDNVE